MAALVADEGGWVTSAPNHPQIWMEAPVDSDLPVTLANLGYELKSLGTSERLLPVGAGVAPVMVEVWGFIMPQLVTEKPRKAIAPSS
jgi:hypothetical protein